MLSIMIPETEYFDEKTDTFVNVKKQTLQLEHSLVSISKWESKWKKPFLSTNQKNYEESIDYVRCMTITQNVDPIVYYAISTPLMSRINAYIEDSATATTFTKRQEKKFNSEIITAEIVYYWMVAHQIPFECQRWHLNRLLALIQVCNIKNGPEKKMGKRDQYNQQRAINAARKAKHRTRG